MIRAVEEESDVVIVQLPFLVPWAIRGAKTPRVYHAFGNVLEMATASSSYRGLRRLVARTVASHVDKVQRQCIAQANTSLVTNGQELFDHYRPGRGQAIVSSCLLPEEIGSVKRARPLDDPARVLFVGYLRPEKGIDTLLAAFELLLKQRPGAELHIVGPSAPNKSAIPPASVAPLERLEQQGAVKFLGRKTLGPELFQCFADADVLAVPSRSEGTPRVLVEARAFGCPVVASRVGGVPTSVDDGVDGLLVPPNDPRALAEALVRVLRESDLRQSLISGGIQRAQRTTVEDFADVLYAEATAIAQLN